MKDIYLSVIVPVYNTEKYLKKCLDSIIKAIELLNNNCEIIVINDGSTGNCDQIMEQYKEFSFIRYIKQDNSGRGATRNVGLREANGKYINFIDSDDYIDENMYLDMFNNMEEDVDISICDIQSVSEDYGKELLLIPGKNEKIDDDMIGCFDVMMLPSCVNKIFKRELFDDIYFPENINYEDLATIPAVYLKAKKIKYIPHVYYYYVQNNNSIMNQEYSIEKLNILDALDIVFKRIDKLKLEDSISNRAKYSLFTRRYYEEVLEKIVLSSNKYKLIKAFIPKAQKLIEQIENNKYLYIEISSCGIIKKYFNYKFFNYIKAGNASKINSYLKVKKYYRLLSIIYSSKGLKSM